MKNEKLVLDDFYQAQKWNTLNALGVFNMNVIKNVIINNKVAVLEKYFAPFIPIADKPLSVGSTTNLDGLPAWVREFIAKEKKRGKKDIFAICYDENDDECCICYLPTEHDAEDLYAFLTIGAYNYEVEGFNNQKKMVYSDTCRVRIEIPNEMYCYTEAFRNILLGIYDKFNFVIPKRTVYDNIKNDSLFFYEQVQKLQKMHKSDKV